MVGDHMGIPRTVVFLTELFVSFLVAFRRSCIDQSFGSPLKGRATLYIPLYSTAHRLVHSCGWASRQKCGFALAGTLSCIMYGQ
jgi:hypothetical protein